MERWILEKTPRQICFCNAYTLTEFQRNSEFRSVAENADMVLADGTSLVWSSQFLGLSLPERVAGPDLMEAFCALAEQKGYRLFFMGCTDEVLEKLRSQLLRQFPRLIIAGHLAPPMMEIHPEDHDAEAVRVINASSPDVLWVGMSSPKQDLWIARNLKRLQVPVSIGVGAAFNFLSGEIKRAPRWTHRTGLEWLWRLCHEPRRLWRRYLFCNIAFLRLIFKEVLRRHTLRLIDTK